jgi:hypothetical protein
MPMTEFGDGDAKPAPSGDDVGKLESMDSLFGGDDRGERRGGPRRPRRD